MGVRGPHVSRFSDLDSPRLADARPAGPQGPALGGATAIPAGNGCHTVFNSATKPAMMDRLGYRPNPMIWREAIPGHEYAGASAQRAVKYGLSLPIGTKGGAIQGGRDAPIQVER